jgi:DNA-directed RNA polymerase subunit L
MHIGAKYVLLSNSFINNTSFFLAMEFEVLENKQKRLVVVLHGADHTICNVLVDALWQESGVTNVAYTIDHPLVGKPRIVIETSSTHPKDVLVSAIKKVKKSFASLI